jgi:4-amino-4-deoxy-L-arabinose transferase-like glycosyltransferase
MNLSNVDALRRDLGAASSRPAVVRYCWLQRANRRGAAALLNSRLGTPLLLGVVLGNALLWIAALTILKSAQVLHSDSTEAFAWGQTLAWGSGKHPPMVGWVARAWFSVFPTSDWAFYALAMAVTGATVLLIRLLAGKVVDRRRAVLATLLAMIYPILNFKGYKFNPDLLQLPFVVLIVWAYMVAAERRTALWGVAIGLAGAGAVMTKYWGAWALVAIAVAAVTRPDRNRLFRSPVPYVAFAVFVLAMAPHLDWLYAVGFTPFRYASQYLGCDRVTAAQSAIDSTLHAFALLLPALGAGAVAVLLPRLRRVAAPPADALDRACQIWIIVAVLTIGPLIAAIAMPILMKSDWTVPLFSLVPLAVLALPRLAVPLRAVARAAVILLVLGMGALMAAPGLATVKVLFEPNRALSPRLDRLAEIATDLWRERVGTPLMVVVGDIEEIATVSFYSTDHPRMFAAGTPELTPWISADMLDRSGFVGICPAAAPACVDRITALRPCADRIVVTTERGALGQSLPPDRWVVLLALPEADTEAASLEPLVEACQPTALR